MKGWTEHQPLPTYRCTPTKGREGLSVFAEAIGMWRWQCGCYRVGGRYETPEEAALEAMKHHKLVHCGECRHPEWRTETISCGNKSNTNRLCTQCGLLEKNV